MYSARFQNIYNINRPIIVLNVDKADTAWGWTKLTALPSKHIAI